MRPELPLQHLKLYFMNTIKQHWYLKYKDLVWCLDSEYFLFFVLERFQGQKECEYQENLSPAHFSRVAYFIFAHKKLHPVLEKNSVENLMCISELLVKIYFKLIHYLSQDSCCQHH